MYGNNVGKYFECLRNDTIAFLFRNSPSQIVFPVGSFLDHVGQVDGRPVGKLNSPLQKVRVKVRKVEPEFEVTHILFGKFFFTRIFFFQRRIFGEPKNLYFANTKCIPDIVQKKIEVVVIEILRWL